MSSSEAESDSSDVCMVIERMRQETKRLSKNSSETEIDGNDRAAGAERCDMTVEGKGVGGTDKIGSEQGRVASGAGSSGKHEHVQLRSKQNGHDGGNVSTYNEVHSEDDDILDL